MPYWPTSSLSLALSAMLVLIPTTEDKFPMAETNLALRRSYAHLFAHAALAAAETETDDLAPALNTNPPGIESLGLDGLHPQVPIQLSPVLALVVLAIYEYCQRGNISRMRARGNQAITTAMDISIHALDSTITGYSEAQRRAWWMTPWPIMMKTQVALYESSKMVQNIERVGETADLSDFGTRIRNLDSDLVSLIGEADRHLLTTFDQEPEASVAQTMWMISRMFIHASRNRLHRFRAFMDIPLFLDKYCDLAAINSANFPHETSAPKWVANCETSFPFTEQESSVICLKSALVITTIYRNLPYPNPHGSVPSRSTTYPKTIPYFACSAMQSCYALLMLLHRLRASLATDRLASCYHLLHDPTPVSEIADAERLREELRHGVEILGRSLKSDVIFEGVGGMGREIEGAYLAAFSNCFEI
ncbi:Tetratricopeptide-like helical [Penicillium cf. griseofulvum]|uniref:Tetratricopeptide-like helical n=1 Tax=Penicillium cf. griseofulvum TaxID=2972120 RepID=A0A9W9JP56_9EURO|nr:Tetratricopeptide-like helical [Penicillium cf. griseofulvum]KAJ5442755.1 Tetratricopeptide-like helical [Penicillium cf. griseofulvum]